MKLYYALAAAAGAHWQLPGQQEKRAIKVDVPTDSGGLAAFLNERQVPMHGPSLSDDFTIPDDEVVPTGSTFDTPPPAPAKPPAGTPETLAQARLILRAQEEAEQVCDWIDTLDGPQLGRLVEAVMARASKLAKQLIN